MFIFIWVLASMPCSNKYYISIRYCIMIPNRSSYTQRRWIAQHFLSIADQPNFTLPIAAQKLVCWTSQLLLYSKSYSISYCKVLGTLFYAQFRHKFLLCPLMWGSSNEWWTGTEQARWMCSGEVIVLTLHQFYVHVCFLLLIIEIGIDLFACHVQNKCLKNTAFVISLFITIIMV